MPLGPMGHDDCSRAADRSLADGGQRRRVITLTVAGLALGLCGITSAPAAARPAPGDRLVLDDDVAGAPIPLRAQDVPANHRPVLAFPFDLATQRVRNDSRLNKIVLIRFAESELDAETRARAAGGVLAFSAVCTHQACDVKTWIAKDKALVCFCHSSKFMPLEAGRVSEGPAARALPTLPLGLQDGQLIIAGAFSARPGPANQ